MRLLNTGSLDFAEFFDSDIPKYAILSHCWGAREIGFKEVRKRTAPAGPALRKIERCCRQAASDGWQWVWIDTCCIDKRSSAELSEAINSMYKWYQRSEVCYVYLSDFHFSPAELSKKSRFLLSTVLKYGTRRPFESVEEGGRSMSLFAHWFNRQPDFMRRFGNCVWFTRGWTLQELLAPKSHVFFDAEWNEIGTKLDLRLAISAATKIPEDYMLGPRHEVSNFMLDLSHEISIATRMSFAANRVTSREEDIAYCLLGLFDVAMPLLYGEGATNAFQRLQIEIMRKSSDESLFAWTSDAPVSGLLAPNPTCFADSGTLVSFKQPRRRFAMSNIGLELPVPDHLPEKGSIPIYLNCGRSSDPITLQGPNALCIQLRVKDNEAFRIRCDLLDPAAYPQRYEHFKVGDLRNEMKNTRNIYVRQPNKIEVLFNGAISQLESANYNY
ncbi:MAG: hypothetical protein L6R42_006114 [Xanthoria sp. 1 TBL-2021]|nr:MAG: hypothetical protein L6R42_006114 [Xanthoria sp. 1 TBL-2021]